MGFAVKLLVLVFLGSIISFCVGASLQSPLAGVLAMVVLALMGRKGVVEEAKETEDEDKDDNDDYWEG